MKHTVHLFRRLSRTKTTSNTTKDTWDVEVDGIRMLLCYSSMRTTKGKRGIVDRLQFRNKGVSKHEDYPAIRTLAMSQLNKRYGNPHDGNPHVDVNKEIPKTEDEAHNRVS